MDRRTAAFAAALLILGACVPRAKANKQASDAYTKGFALAEGECFELQKQLKVAFEQLLEEKAVLQRDLDAKNARLELFNQLNADKTIKEKKPKVTESIKWTAPKKKKK